MFNILRLIDGKNEVGYTLRHYNISGWVPNSFIKWHRTQLCVFLQNKIRIIDGCYTPR